MKFKYCFVILLLLFASIVNAQSFIKGVVRDNKGRPIALASVFINNSSIGTTSNYDGSFNLNYNMTSPIDLVISHVNYESQLLIVTPGSNSILNIQLSEKNKELSNVTVESYEKGSWKKWGSLFKDLFLGITENSSTTKILNTNDIEFRFYKNSNQLIVYNKKPIQVQNKALGYLIQYDLQNFEYNFKTKYCSYSGLVYFKETENNPVIIANRENTYTGSIKHFISALYQNKLNEEGFNVVRVRKIANEAKLKAKEELTQAVSKNKKIVIDSRTTAINQPDSFDVVYSKNINSDSLLLKKDGIAYFYFPNYLSVSHPVYNNLIQLPKNTLPEFVKRADLSIANHEDNMIVIYPDGSYYPAEGLTSIYRWSLTENVSNLLPVNYFIQK